MTQDVEPLSYQSPALPSQQQQDVSHLNALAICHYIWGGLTLLFSSVPIIHITLGIMMLNNPGWTGAPPNSPPPFVAWMFICMGSGIVALGWTTGILTIVSGRGIHNRRRRIFSLVMAGINCVSFPFGTLLGVFTFIVLLRDSVKVLYDYEQMNQRA